MRGHFGFEPSGPFGPGGPIGCGPGFFGGCPPRHGPSRPHHHEYENGAGDCGFGYPDQGLFGHGTFGREGYETSWYGPHSPDRNGPRRPFGHRHGPFGHQRGPFGHDRHETCQRGSDRYGFTSGEQEPCGRRRGPHHSPNRGHGPHSPERGHGCNCQEGQQDRRPRGPHCPEKPHGSDNDVQCRNRDHGEKGHGHRRPEQCNRPPRHYEHFGHCGPPGHFEPLGPIRPHRRPVGPWRRPFPYNERPCCSKDKGQNSEESGSETECRGKRDRRNCKKNKDDNRDTILVQRIVVEKAPRCYSV